MCFDFLYGAIGTITRTKHAVNGLRHYRYYRQVAHSSCSTTVVGWWYRYGLDVISHLYLFQGAENFGAEGVIVVVYNVFDLSRPVYHDALQVLHKVLKE